MATRMLLDNLLVFVQMNVFVRNIYQNLALDIFENVQSLGDVVFLSAVNALCTIRIRPVTSLTAKHQWPDALGQTFVIRRVTVGGSSLLHYPGCSFVCASPHGLWTLYFGFGLRAR